jgi:hypothetical protein
VWRSDGNVHFDGPVTATLAGTAFNASIAVTRYSGVDLRDPVSAVASANTNGIAGPCNGGVDSRAYSIPIATTDPMSLVYSAAAMRHRTHVPLSRFIERAEIASGGFGNVASVAVSDRSTLSPSVIDAAGSFSGRVDWAAAAVVLRPSPLGVTTTSTTSTTLAFGRPFHARTVRISRLNKPAGEQKLSLQSIDLDAADLSFAPADEGMRILVEGAGSLVLDATVAAADPGWRANGSTDRWKKSSSAPDTDGLRSARISAAGTRFRVSVKAADIDATAAMQALSLKVTFIVGDHAWTGTARACTLSGSGNTLRCR